MNHASAFDSHSCWSFIDKAVIEDCCKEVAPALEMDYFNTQVTDVMLIKLLNKKLFKLIFTSYK